MESSLSERDKKVIWHPYTQHKNMLPPIAIAHANGALLFDESGKNYIDAISSWWVNIHGHAHPYIAEKIYEQARKLEQVIFTGFTHEPAVLLAERLMNILPGDFSKIFYSDNGSTAVEVAIKMAIQFWRNTFAAGSMPNSSRKKILAFRNAYHGDTFGAMSISERSVFTASFNDYLFEVIFIDTPTKGNIDDIKKVIRENAAAIAGFIYEPVLQGAGGMKMYDTFLFDELLAEIKSLNIICIADEVMTGFGRTGKPFACDFMENKPDIICLSKGLTGGTMALSITAASEKIFEAFVSDDRTKTLFHGHSFTANPVACSAALASLDLFEKEACQKQIKSISMLQEQFCARLQKSHNHLQVKNIRCLGTIAAFEIEEGSDGYLNNVSSTITQRALENGIYLRPLGNTVYILPPYCITEKQLNQVHEFLFDFLQ
ncbi:MAG TPA: adenosylmethionine--8-amino-7-oxononanoate transaminase [Puia sp.]|nr:adenosylmethionine--8-amino-7-oxononanoate transaminase [Puia sp.]